MKKKRKKRKKPQIGRRGPAQNLRPAGAHRTKKMYSRRRTKDELARELAEQE